MAEQTMRKLNTFGEITPRMTFGGKNATTAIEKFGNKNTPYLKENHGYAKIVGIRFKDNPKVYDYIDLNGTVRAGDSPKVEVTNKWSGANTVVPSKYTKVVNTGKSGLTKNETRLDSITDKGINLKVIAPKMLSTQLTAQKERAMRKLNIMGGESNA